MKIFNMDSPAMRFLGKFANLMILNWIMIICCIPIVTIGPAITAAYCVALKMVRNEEGGIFHDFMHSFRINMKQGIVVGLIVIGIGLGLAFEIYWMYQISQFGSLFDKLIFYVLIFLAAIFLMTVNYVWSLLARFNNTTNQLFRTARALAVRHIMATIVMGVIAAIPVVMMMYSMASLTLAGLFYLWLGIPAIAYLQGIFMLRIFDQYMPKDEEETDETETLPEE